METVSRLAVVVLAAVLIYSEAPVQRIPTVPLDLSAFMGGLVAWAAEGIVAGLRAVLGFFTMDAQGANRWLVLNGAGLPVSICNNAQIATDVQCWSSAGTGGAQGASVPGPSDTAIMDGGSWTGGGGVGTFNAAMSVYNWTMNSTFAAIIDTAGFSLTVGAGGFYEAAGQIHFRGSLVAVSGNLYAPTGLLTYETSTVVLANGGGTDYVYLGGGNAFYNLTVALGATVQTRSQVEIKRQIVVNGTLVIGNNQQLILRNLAGVSNALVRGPSSSVSGAGGYALFSILTQGGTLLTVPGGSYAGVELKFGTFLTLSGDGYEFRLLGDISSYGITLQALAANGPFFLNTQAYNVTTTNYFQAIGTVAPLFGVKATGGAWSIGGNLQATTSGDTQFYISAPSTAWTLYSGYLNTVTTNALRWSGPSQVRFASRANPTTITPGWQLGKQELGNVVFNTSRTNGGFPFYLSGPIWAGTITVSGSNSTSTSTLTTSNYTVRTQNFTVSYYGGANLTSSRVYTCDWYSVHGLSDNPRTSTLDLDCSGRVLTNQLYFDYNFYNVVVEAGVTTTWASATFVRAESVCSSVISIGVRNQLTVNGTILSGMPEMCYATATFWVDSVSTSRPIVMGAAGDLTRSGYVAIVLKSSTVSHFYLDPMTAYHLTVQDETAFPSGTVVVDMTGDLRTVDCIAQYSSPGGLGQVNEAHCAILLTGYANRTFTFNTNSHILGAGGSLWLGDVYDWGVNFHAGASLIYGRPVTVIGGAVAYFEQATVYSKPSTVWSPMGFEMQYDGQLYGGTASFWICGSFVTWWTQSAFPGHSPPFSTAVHAENSTWHVQKGCNDTPQPWTVGNAPGDVTISQGQDVLDLGNSTWYVDGNFSSASYSGAAGPTATIYFGAGAASIHANGTLLGNIVFTAAATVRLTGSVAVRDLMAWLGGVVLLIDPTGSLSIYGGHIYGPGGSQLTLRSSTPGVQWRLFVPEGSTASYVDAQDSAASSLISACLASTDSGDNTNWVFNCNPPPPPPPPPPPLNITFPGFGGFFGSPNPNVILEFGLLLLLLVGVPIIAWRLLVRRRAKGSGEGAIREGPSLRPRRGGRTISTAPRRARRRGE